MDRRQRRVEGRVGRKEGRVDGWEERVGGKEKVWMGKEDGKFGERLGGKVGGAGTVRGANWWEGQTGGRG